MKNITEFINNTIVNETILNEARMKYWMVLDVDTDVSYLVSASSLEEAKSMVAQVAGESELAGWLVELGVKEPRIIMDSDMIKTKGDKKY